MKVSVLSRFAVCMFFLLRASYGGAAPQEGGYHLLKKTPLGVAPSGREYFDYITVDASTRRVYLSHGTEVKVIDADNYAVVGSVSGLKQDHGIALANELGKGFISDGAADRVVIFDLKTLAVIGEVKTGGNPDYILYDPASKYVFAFNGSSKDSTVIDAANGTVVKTLPMGGRPEQAVADGKGLIYDNISDTNEVAVIDSRALTIKARWPVAPGGEPISMAMDREHRRLFIGARNPKLLAVMNADSGSIIQTFEIGDHVDANAYDPGTGQVFAATREGTLHVFNEDSPDKFSVVEIVRTEFGAKTMGLDPKTHNLYLDTSDFGPPPEPTAEQPHPQPTAILGTFRLLVYGR